MDERESIIQDLKRQIDTERDKNRSLEDSYKFRVASFVKRETETRNKVDSLERRLNEGPENDEQSAKMEIVRKMHRDVVDTMDCIQNKTAKMLQEQEKDLMKAFRHHLSEVATEHEELKNQKGEHSSELQAKHRKVMGDLYEAQGLAQGYDKENQQLQAENKKLQERLRTREDDRQALLKELVIAKKDLARVKAQYKEAPAELGSDGEDEDVVAKQAAKATSTASKSKGFTDKQIEQARLQQTRNRIYEREVDYREAITKLRRTLEDERSLSRGLKEQHTELLQRRTELEAILRQCLDDVKAEILRQRGSMAGPSPFPSQSVAGLSVHDLTPQDRERVLELLLSQQRVVQLLYSRSVLGDASAAEGGSRDDFAWLGDVVSSRQS